MDAQPEGTPFPAPSAGVRPTDPPFAVQLAAFLLFLVMVGGAAVMGIATYLLESPADEDRGPGAARQSAGTETLPNTETPSPVTPRRRPRSSAAEGSLAPADRGFVDKRGGWGWSDRCWKHLKAGQLDWARAACQRGMDLGPASPNPRASLLYNLGLVAEASGDPAEARSYFRHSLEIRENSEVRAALGRVGR